MTVASSPSGIISERIIKSGTFAPVVAYGTMPAQPDFYPPTKQPMSPKHKRRLERQQKRKQNFERAQASKD